MTARRRLIPQKSPSTIAKVTNATCRNLVFGSECGMCDAEHNCGDRHAQNTELGIQQNHKLPA